MRPLAILATVLTCAAANAAGAQSLSLGALSTQALSSDALSVQAMLADAAFAPKTASDDVDPIDRLLERETYQPGAGLVRWTTGQAQLSPQSATGPIDSLRISVGGAWRTPGGLPISRNGQFEADAYEVALTRDWPAALAFDTRAFGVDLTPHAGVGVTNAGGSAEGGVTLRLNQLGVRDGSSFGDRGRWYLFAAASGRAVGLNVLHGEQGWDRAGWSTDQASSLIGDAQLGVGWRKGAVQSSFGYIHRQVKGAHQLWGVDAKDDSLVAFSLSIRPHN
jgi:hypothetical protein